MGNSGLVSIIMPAYNPGEYINDAIRSVLDQTYSDWELIIVDDGSTDNTAQKVKSWIEKDNRIQYYYQENGKQGKARNLGVSKSKGEYLAFLDADDLWLSEKLEFQIKEIQEKKVDLVFSDSYVFNNNEIVDTSKRMNVPDEVFYSENDIKLFLEGNRIPILTVLVKKEKVINVGCFSEELPIQNVEDYHLWLKLLMSNYLFYSSNRVMGMYRVHSNAATSSDKLVLNKIPNVLFDLKHRHPDYKNEIQQALKIKFRFIYNRNLFTKSELAFWIKINTQYLSKSYLVFIYLFLNILLPTKITKRSLIYFLNA
ncbi:glycosyltransferase family 2 protein [Flavobacterium sp. DGU38]|uniref:Glycosyltransferase family 2 protein n=1 Tax=Flavobacterium calami TaxID=3139144 RepID=A0ABU9IJR2_9FLAO